MWPGKQLGCAGEALPGQRGLIVAHYAPEGFLFSFFFFFFFGLDLLSKVCSVWTLGVILESVRLNRFSDIVSQISCICFP